MNQPPTSGIDRPSADAPATWDLDLAHTQVEFSAKHMMLATMKGRFASVSGSIFWDPRNLPNSTVELTIDAGSIDTGNDQRDEHLRSPDFLDAEKYPQLTFRSRRIDPVPGVDEARYQVTGDLTIRGVTREIVVDATFDGRARDPWGNDRVGYHATTSIDRRDFGLVWNVALETGGILVGDAVRIAVEGEATRRAA